MPSSRRLRDLGQPRLGVAHGGGIIAVDIAEIALPVDQRIALREILRQPHQRVIDRLVAVRMKLADDVADHARAFLERRAGIEPQLLHRVEQPPVHRLEPVARIRQRAVHDGGERIGEIALLQRIPQRDVLDVAGRRGNQLFAHASRGNANPHDEQGMNAPDMRPFEMAGVGVAGMEPTGSATAHAVHRRRSATARDLPDLREEQRRQTCVHS